MRKEVKSNNLTTAMSNLKNHVNLPLNITLLNVFDKTKPVKIMIKIIIVMIQVVIWII